ncbi:hypothetical protein Tco_1367292 [Tanacetum coccineum]
MLTIREDGGVIRGAIMCRNQIKCGKATLLVTWEKSMHSGKHLSATICISKSKFQSEESNHGNSERKEDENLARLMSL